MTLDDTKHTSKYLSEEPRKAYQTPTLTIINSNETESGDTEVPESSNGLIS